tara:strand:+ start:3295 stop:4065 length:771 start_codon:yes stop_codon:yes gene_type:complete
MNLQFKDVIIHNHIMTYYPNKSVGWGNVALCLSDLMHRSPEPTVNSGIFDVERDVELTGFKISDNPDDEPFDARIVINPFYFQKVHKNLKDIVKPNKNLQKLIDENEHGLSYGLHIRRGACSKDSEHIGCHGKDEDGKIKPAFFARDSALQKFVSVVEKTDAKFFLASDSTEIKTMFKERFPDKIVTVNHQPTLSYDCITLQNKGASRTDAYLDWFLLSKCKNIYITAGNEDLTDFSTFGYSAGAYGGSNIHFVFN